MTNVTTDVLHGTNEVSNCRGSGRNVSLFIQNKIVYKDDEDPASLRETIKQQEAAIVQRDKEIISLNELITKLTADVKQLVAVAEASKKEIVALKAKLKAKGEIRLSDDFNSSRPAE